MRGPVVLLAIAITSLAQTAPVADNARPETTIARGVPLRVALERRMPIKRVGEPVQGRLVEPIYVFDRMVLPAGTVVDGHVAKIGGVPAGKRVAAILSGNFTPPREVRAQFDAILFSDGSRLSLLTAPSHGTAHTNRISKPPEARTERRTARDKFNGMEPAAILAFKEPGKMNRLKSRLFSMLPYHRQSWRAGTLFDSVLQEPLILPETGPIGARTNYPAGARPGAPEVRARLLTSLSSATARKGAPVEAAVTQPLFSAEHALLVPEGSRLLGEVTEVRRARFLHRNGKLLFVFHEIKLPSGTAQSIQGYIEGVEADFDTHLSLDSEGAARVDNSKIRFIFPAIAATMAGLSLHQDYNAQGVPDQDVGGRAESGAVGLGLVGTLLAQASRPLASTIAFTGAGFSLYSTFIARGADVVLPANTPVEISFKTREGEPDGGQPLKRDPR